jgi:predicted DNA-binding mobile mystery protein A
MDNKLTIKKIQLNQLDKKVAKLREFALNPSPELGWIKEIRETLGISARQLANRVGMSQATLAKIEKGEVEKTVSLKTLNKIAEALESKLIYAFVPKRSFEVLVRDRAQKSAERLVKRVSHSMELEDQGLIQKKREEQIKSIADEMVRTLSKEIWENWK